MRGSVNAPTPFDPVGEEERSVPNPSEDRFLGALLGLAIGDALGMPVAGLSRQEIIDRHGTVEAFLPHRLPDGTEIAAGEVTDETETVLSMVEGMTTAAGRIDADTIGPRLVHLVAGESRRWFPPATREALDRAADSLVFDVPLAEDEPAPADVAVRGVPIGLLHAVGTFDLDALRANAERAVRLTHGGTRAVAATEAVALAIRLAARGEEPPERWPALVAESLGTGEMASALASLQDSLDRGVDPEAIAAGMANETGANRAVPLALLAAIQAAVFEAAVVFTVNQGGEADSVGALAGALAGTRFGSAGIPQGLIDDLGSRIYISLAAPWFFKTAQRRAGVVIDLRPRLGGPRPPLPPRI